MGMFSAKGCGTDPLPQQRMLRSSHCAKRHVKTFPVSCFIHGLVNRSGPSHLKNKDACGRVPALISPFFPCTVSFNPDSLGPKAKAVNSLFISSQVTFAPRKQERQSGILRDGSLHPQFARQPRTSNKKTLKAFGSYLPTVLSQDSNTMSNESHGKSGGAFNPGNPSPDPVRKSHLSLRVLHQYIITNV